MAQLQSGRRLRHILVATLVVFLITSLCAAFLMLLAVFWFPLAMQKIGYETLDQVQRTSHSLAEQWVRMVTVSRFGDLFKRENILPLMVFAVMIGLACRSLGERGRIAVAMLQAGSDVCMKFISYVMYYAPIGLAAYFAVTVANLGPSVLGSYGQVFILYLGVSLFYFLCVFSVSVWCAGGSVVIKRFWQHTLLPATTAVATQSSMATVPANLLAVEAMGLAKESRETVVLLGASIHKEGSAMGAILKIAFVFAMMGLPFSGWGVCLTALGVALVSAVIMGGIPGGGLMAEMFIISVYGLPSEYLPLLAIISTLIDVPATLVNAVGDNVAAIWVDRAVR